jgi:hypothetical protein
MEPSDIELIQLSYQRVPSETSVSWLKRFSNIIDMKIAETNEVLENFPSEESLLNMSHDEQMRLEDNYESVSLLSTEFKKLSNLINKRLQELQNMNTSTSVQEVGGRLRRKNKSKTIKSKKTKRNKKSKKSKKSKNSRK